MTPTTPSPISDQAAGEPIAWMHRDGGSALTARQKECARPDTVVGFDVPCYAAAPTPLSWSSVQISALLEDADRLSGYPGKASATLFDLSRVTRELLKAPRKLMAENRASTLTLDMDRSQFHDKAWALYQSKALDDSKLPKLSVYTIRTLWNALYDSMPLSTAPTTGSAAHPSIARAIAQEERACRAEDALIDLVNQIRKSNPVDDHGHDLKMNRAYLESVKLLDAVALLAASMGGDKS